MIKNNFSIVLDSTFRIKEEYPESTRFVVPVNDIITTNYINSPIHIFSWEESINYIDGTISGGSQSSIILSNDFQKSLYNFYVGCQLVLYNAGNPVEYSTIISYNNATNTVNVAIPFSNSVQVNDDIRIVYYDSYVNPYTIQLTAYNPEAIFEYSALYLYNFTKNWIIPIRNINSLGIANLTLPIPLSDYDYSDILEIRTSTQTLQYSITSFVNGITKYSIRSDSFRYPIGSHVYVEPGVPGGINQTYLVKDYMNHQMILEVEQYGGPFNINCCYTIYSVEDPLVDIGELSTMYVLETRTIIDVGNQAIPSPENNVIYVGDTILAELFYYNYKLYHNYIILIDDVYPYSTIVKGLPGKIGFLTKQVLQCALNVANFSFPDNQVCMNIKLDCLILPNRRVKDYDKLLSFLPYVIVKLYNVDTSQYSKYGNITSNNPTSTNAQFICPIGNLLNPTIIKFVEVKSDMIQTLKLSPHHDIFFEVLLPNGNLLLFENEPIPIANIINFYNFTIRDTVACLLSISL